MPIEKSVSWTVFQSWVELNQSWKGRQTKGNVKEIRTLTPNDFDSLSEWKDPGVFTGASWHI